MVLSTTAKELPVATPESQGMSSERLAGIDRVVERALKERKLAGATVMIARHGWVVYFKPFGKMNLEADQPMREDTILRIYSMSKAITTAAAMMLFEEGKFSLDDPVGTFLPEWSGLKVWHADGNRWPNRQPTVRDLMRHTAGLT